MTKNCIIFLILIVTPALLLPACNKDDVIIEEGNDDTGVARPVTSESKASFDKVYEWTPAPGQFINEAGSGDDFTTPESAAAWAQKRLEAGQYVSLGGFGGYIVVGFDHSVMSSDGDYDFAIAGNSFFNASTSTGGSNEPGIVYVMQDVNGNGLADDEWYELKGSEYGNAETIDGYEVTYYRPSSAAMDVEWTDNLGNKGTIDYLSLFHKQDYYYPLWIEDDSYTLRGTCLKARNRLNPDSGTWDNNAYGWGYADNMGSDNVSVVDFPQCNRFRISDAVNADGEPVNIGYIDFIKVQTGVNTKSGWLGELSTEVCGFFDLNL